MYMGKKRKLNNKYYLYCFSPGDKEREYFKKYIQEQETLKDLINYNGISSDISQMPPNIKGENKDELISKIIQYIERRCSNINEQGKGKIIAIITDCDKAKLEYMNDFKSRFKNKFGDKSIFILNYQSFEDWGRIRGQSRKYFGRIFILNYQSFEDWAFFYYGDNKKTKDEIGRDISEHWDSIFKGKHNIAIAKYFKTINYPNKENESINNYNDIHFKQYSDFPNVFKYLENL